MGIKALGICVSPPIVGLPLLVIANGHPVVPGGNVDATFPLMAAEVPPTLIPPFAPTSPPLFSRVGKVGLVALSPAELKLPVATLPPKDSGAGLQPVPVAKSPPGWFPVTGDCASSACTSRRAPVMA